MTGRACTERSRSNGRAYIEEVKTANPIEEIAAGYTHLTQDGQRRLKGLCPLHQEHHPSFVVYPEQGRWWCYGACQRGGDVIDLVMGVEGLPFRAAMDSLAARAGITPMHEVQQTNGDGGMQRAIHDVLALTTAYYQAHLREDLNVRALLLERGFTKETIQDAGLGVAGLSGLAEHLHAQGVDLALAQRAGVVRDDGRDYFRQRLIIPYFSHGEVVYLSGRALHPAQEPKYLHLPVNRWVQRPLYNVDALRGSGELFLVEGFADVLTLEQWGFLAVGLNGTGLNHDELSAVRQHRTVYLALDSDEAGRQAALSIAPRIGPETRLLTWPEGVQDANDYLQQGHTREDFRRLTGAAPTLVEVKIAEAAEKQGAEQDQVVQELFWLLTEVSPFALSRYRQRIGAELGITAREFQRLLRVTESSRHAEGTEPSMEVVEGAYRILSPALDFLEDLACVAVPLLVHRGGEISYYPHLVTSSRQLIPIESQRLLTLNGQQLVLREAPTALPQPSRWAYSHLRRFLEGYTPDPARIFQTVVALFDRYLDFRTPETAQVLALWIMGTYLYPTFEAYPYIALMGPKGSGKTKTITLAGKLAFNMRVVSDISTSGLFRVIEATRGTLGIDECERLASRRDALVSDLRLLLNAGYKRGSPVIRVEGEDFQVREFQVYAPKVLASVRGLEDVLESRCILIHMLRTTTAKGNLAISESGEDWAGVRHQLYSFALTHFQAVRGIYEGDVGVRVLSNRNNELWLPLLSLAKLVDDAGVAGLFDATTTYAQASTRHSEGSTLSEWEQAFLLALRRLTNDQEQALVTTKQIRHNMAQFMDEEEVAEVRSQWIGYTLKRLGFTDKERRAGGNVYRVRRVEVGELLLRYEVEPPAGEEGG